MLSTASTGLVLSLFPGIDLYGRAFEAEGYCVVRGPDPLFGGDVRAGCRKRLERQRRDVAGVTDPGPVTLEPSQ